MGEIKEGLIPKLEESLKILGCYAYSLSFLLSWCKNNLLISQSFSNYSIIFGLISIVFAFHIYINDSPIFSINFQTICVHFSNQSNSVGTCV